MTLCSLYWGRERLCCWLEAVKLLESRSCRMLVELLVAEAAVGVDHYPEGCQIVSCYCLETINKNEGDYGGDRVGGCWWHERSGERSSALSCDTCELVRTSAKVRVIVEVNRRYSLSSPRLTSKTAGPGGQRARCRRETLEICFYNA